MRDKLYFAKWLLVLGPAVVRVSHEAHTEVLKIIGGHLSDNVATLATRRHNVEAQMNNYYRTETRNGMTPYAIRTALMETGWSEEHVVLSRHIRTDIKVFDRVMDATDKKDVRLLTPWLDSTNKISVSNLVRKILPVALSDGTRQRIFVQAMYHRDSNPTNPIITTSTAKRRMIFLDGRWVFCVWVPNTAQQEPSGRLRRGDGICFGEVIMLG